MAKSEKLTVKFLLAIIGHGRNTTRRWYMA